MTVIDAEGRRIPWPRVSHFDDDAMREPMREIVDKVYAFLPGPAFAEGVVTEPFAGMAGCRFAFAPHPEPVEDMLYRVHAVFEESDGHL